MNDNILKLMRKINEIFSNTVKINKEKSDFSKSIFTICNYRKDDKCPLGLFKQVKCYTIIKKTIYYDNAIIKVYDIPFFIFLNFSS